MLYHVKTTTAAVSGDLVTKRNVILKLSKLKKLAKNEDK
jgi:hypothetical protein